MLSLSTSLPLLIALLVVDVDFALANALPQTPVKRASSSSSSYSSSSSSSASSMELFRRSPGAAKRRTVEQWGSWARGHRVGLAAKYGSSAQGSEKRSSGTNLLINQNYDSSFYGSLAIGTPATSFNIILDTGSADLWIADSSCLTNCDSIPTFNPSSSSTFISQNTTFSITYGSGNAAGSLGQDIVQMAGFSVNNQIFATCDTVSQGLLNEPVSGLLGLAFSTISSAGVVPFWETLVTGGAWDAPVMAFQLTRFIDDDNADEQEPGGSFTMGFVNSTLYTGDIEFIDIPAGMDTYWVQRISAITVQGTTVNIGTSDSSTLAAIDTGTTLVGGPADGIAAIYAQIPGSAPGSGNFDGYYTYPCDTTVSVTMSFGGAVWSIDPADFQLTQLSRSLCLGAFFELSTGSSAPAWIVGDTFLKNVYSVFRYEPAAVGFAALSEYALSLNGLNAALPSPTIGSAAVAISATGTVREQNFAVPRLRGSAKILVYVAVAVSAGMVIVVEGVL